MTLSHNARWMVRCRGIFQTISVTYAAEVAPVSLRPYLTTYVNLCWVIGQLLAAGVLKGLLGCLKSAFKVLHLPIKHSLGTLIHVYLA